ncbi:hypothetical protein P692DRAFT_20821408 [Suillus brevipes Sb2]|nr:hypothetical protein P692DRAFT_20821408 [Suillus brevipes Sb2]
MSTKVSVFEFPQYLIPAPSERHQHLAKGTSVEDWDTSSCSSAIAIGSGDVAVGCVDALVVAFFQIGNPVLLLGFADFLGDLSAVLAVLFADGVLRESSWLIGKLT